MANNYRFSSIIFIVVFLIHQSHANPRTVLLKKSCTNINARNGSRYVANYVKLMQEMRIEMNRNLFSVKKSGRPPDRLYVLAQCMNDLSGEECGICFDNISHVFSENCFPRTGGRVYFDGCFIRAENYSFSQETNGNEDEPRCGNNVDNRKEFVDTAKQVINGMVKQAPQNEGYAEKHQHSTKKDISVYGMAQCWKTLNGNRCASCLENAAQISNICLPAKEGRVLNAGCYLRYSDSDFANKLLTDPFAARDIYYSYSKYVLAGIAVCGLVILIGFAVGKIVYRLINNPNKSRGLEMKFSVIKRSLQFKYTTLVKATDNFNEARKLGQGGFGEVFKGTMPDGREIAIKRLFISGKNRTEEVYNEIDIISRAKHRNLVCFIGFCFTNESSFLVYEFLANRSLNCILFDPERKKELDWMKRLRIIKGTAEGLEYLHKDCQVRIVHRDIKASNILLDLKHKPKIADFGLARFCSCEKYNISTAVAGTLGYMAPEYLAQGRLTEKVDVYSFGVLVLEIISGVQNNKFESDKPLETLVTAAWKHFQSDNISEIIDRNMEIKDEELEEVKRIVQVGLLCTQETPSLRPTMTTVVKMIRHKDFELPLPSKPPFMDMMELSHSFSVTQLRPLLVSSLGRPQNSDNERRLS